MKSTIFNRVKFFSKLNLIQKFLLTYCILILVPLSILFGYTYTRMSKITSDNIINSTKQAFEQSTDFLTYKLYRIFDISNSIVIDNTLTTILRKNPKEYPISEQVSDFYDLRYYLTAYQTERDVYNVSLYFNDNFIYSKEEVNFFGMSLLKDSNSTKYIHDNNLRFLWCPPSYLDKHDSDDFLSLVKTIKNPDNLSEDIGYLRLNFKKTLVEEIINKINSINGSISYIINSEGIIIASSKNSDLEKYNIDLALIKKLSDEPAKLNLKKVNDENLYIQSTLIDKTDWYMVNILPESSILSKINNQRAYLILLVIICGGTSICLAIYFVNSINKRLSKVIDGMRSVHNGDLTNFLENDSDDELGELIDNYNYMIGKMTILIDEHYKSGQEVKNAELKALQAQINPHFLYNTLDMINWMAYKNMNSEISTAVKSLAKFYKLSLNRGKSITKIEDELLHASLYVQIQNMRYNNRITLNIRVNDNIKNYSIPKITLQPIIENAINHGILGRGAENGSILISGFKDNDTIVLQISDDGIGIPKDKIDLILSNELIKSKGSGYGLKNINERIKLLYGEKYGLSFTSNYNHGTTVEITIPIIN